MSDILPAQQRNSAFFPPASLISDFNLTLSCADGKIEFSTDKITFSSSITVGLGDRYYIEWASGINSASQGQSYSSTITFTYNDLGVSEDVDININSIDKVPDQFTFVDVVDVFKLTTQTSNAVAMLGSINAPTSIWGSSDSTSAHVKIGETDWTAIPSTPGTLFVQSRDEIRVRHMTLEPDGAATTTTINIGYGDQPGEFVTDNFVTTNYTTGNIPSSISQPQIVYPANGATGQSIWEPLIIGSAYQVSGSNPGTLATTFWEVATDSNFNNIVVSETVSGTDVQWNVPTYSLSPSTTYYVRTTYTSTEGLTATSIAVNFTTGTRLFTYLDTSRTSYTLPTLTPYHTIIELNFTAGNDGANGASGSGTTPGGGGPGGDQGDVKVNSFVKSSTTSITLNSNGIDVVPVATSGQDGNVASVLAYQLGTDKDGNPVLVSDIFSDAVNLARGASGTSGTQNHPFGGGPGQGGAGGVTFTYKVTDGTWAEVGGVPSSFPTGATGSTNQPIQDGIRFATGGTGGNGYGAGAGGGAGGAEFEGQLGAPGAGGTPGAGAGAIVLII